MEVEVNYMPKIDSLILNKWMKRIMSSYTVSTKLVSSRWDNYHIKENRKYNNKSLKS